MPPRVNKSVNKGKSWAIKWNEQPNNEMKSLAGSNSRARTRQTNWKTKRNKETLIQNLIEKIETHNLKYFLACPPNRMESIENQ